MSKDHVLAAGYVTRHYCENIRTGLNQLLDRAAVCLQFIDDTDAAVTEQLDAIGDTDAVWSADLRAARNLLTKLAASLEQVRQDLQIAREATEGLDHRAAILLALDLSDTLPWTEAGR
jgi:hypothetical protein